MKDRPYWKAYVLLAMLAVFFTGASAQAAADDIASFYRGKTVRIVVPFPPGASADLHARLLAPVLEKLLKCTVVVINKPGGGGLVAMNDLYEAPRKDGLTLAISPEGLPLAQAMGAPGVRFDCRKFGWITSLYKDFRFLYVALNSPYKTVEDLKKLKPAKASISAVTSPAGPSLIAAIEALGISNAKIVAGYPGGTEIILAVVNREADFAVMTINYLLRKDPVVRPLLAIEETRSPEFPNIPAFTELGIKPEVQKMLDIIMMGQASGRAVVTSPGVPKEKIAFLRKIFSAVFKDPEFLKSIKKVGILLNPKSGEQTALTVEKALNVSPEDVKNLKHVMFEKYF